MEQPGQLVLKRKFSSETLEEKDSIHIGTQCKIQKLESAARALSSSKGSWNCWSHEEEVFLVGAVLERFLSRGSLSSTKKETSNNKHNSWEAIKKIYDNCFKRYNDQAGNGSHVDRTENALSRHYKVMKERSTGDIGLKALYDEWESKYNRPFNLLPDDSNLPKEYSKSFHFSFVGQSKGRWSFADEVVLVGLVLEAFFKRGSLSSTHKERETKENDFWQQLYLKYEKIRMEVEVDNGFGQAYKCQSRTAPALGRHFKVMKSKLLSSKTRGDLKVYYREWVKFYQPVYNKLENASATYAKAKPESNVPGVFNRQLSANSHYSLSPLGSMPLPGIFNSGMQAQLPRIPSGVSNFGYGCFNNTLLQIPEINQMGDRIPSFRNMGIGQTLCAPLPTGVSDQPAHVQAGNPVVTMNGSSTTFWIPMTLPNKKTVKNNCFPTTLVR